MTTVTFTFPATDLRTGQHGTLVLTDRADSGAADARDSSLFLTSDLLQIFHHDSTAAVVVHLADVECVDIAVRPSPGPSAPASIVTVRLNDGSTARYLLSGSTPILIRGAFVEAGWSRPCTKPSRRSTDSTQEDSSPVPLGTSWPSRG